MEKKLSIDDVSKISEKYGVDIEMSFGRKNMLTITNGCEIEIFRTHYWDNTDYQKILSIAKVMKKKDDVRHENTKKYLAKMDASIFPDNLFDTKNKE